jgi:hypothetical protein
MRRSQVNDTRPQTASGKVLMHFSMSLDGFVADPDHGMSWMRDDLTNRPGLIEEYVRTTGAVLGGRAGWDMAAATGARPYGEDWDGPIFVLTHHPEDATHAENSSSPTNPGCGAYSNIPSARIVTEPWDVDATAWPASAIGTPCTPTTLKSPAPLSSLSSTLPVRSRTRSRISNS